jgi:hypothetical protein
MTNSFDPAAYLTSTTTQLGALAWILFLIQLVAIGVGVYLKFVRQDTKALRQRLLQNLGVALMGIGGVGVLLVALRVGSVAPFTQRYWLYMLAMVEAAFAGYVFYYARSVYPAQVAARVASRGKGSQRKATASAPQSSHTQPQNGSAHESEPADSAASRSRRSARRERKRKHR